MAKIVINEISQNYTYNIGNSAYACVALPITSSWGPGYYDPATEGITADEMLERTTWLRYPANQAGLESFVSTYRGPAANYRLIKDYSYQVAMTLLTAGYDVLVCRLCPGTKAQGTFTAVAEENPGTVVVKAKYPGTFGNSLRVQLKKITYGGSNAYWNLIVYVTDAAGVTTSVENKAFVFDLEHSSDTILHWSEVESDFVTLVVSGVTDADTFTSDNISLTGGTDKAADTQTLYADALALAQARYLGAGYDQATWAASQYCLALNTLSTSTDTVKLASIKYKEWLYTACCKTASSDGVYSLLKDKLTYNPNRLISPGWDDQDINAIKGTTTGSSDLLISPMHITIMDTAYYSRCATGYIDIPASLPRSAVWNDSTDHTGYAQKLARYSPTVSYDDGNGGLYTSHCALFAPWGQYTYVGTSRMSTASPSFQALMIQRAQILNQALQYEWALPTNRKHNLNLGKLAYNVPKRYLDQWQSLEGVGVNVITDVPDLGTNVWGNSTLYEVPPAVYQALANLSTRLLVNAVEDVAYRCGISITFQYNNDQAYNKFYAGVTPILDTMKSVGAIDDYYVTMAADINGLDQVNANTIIGKIYLVINGVVNDIYIDLIALPPTVSLDSVRS